MKKLLSYLIIIFFGSLTFSFSEDISDFEIEGISVDDSVLDYFTEETLDKTSKKKMKTRSLSLAESSPSYEIYTGKAEASENIDETMSTEIRAVVFNVFNSLGTMLIGDHVDAIKNITEHDKAAISRTGIRIGAKFFFMPNLLKKNPIELKVLLWKIFFGSNEENTFPLPSDGRVSFPTEIKMPSTYWSAIGYHCLDKFAVRVDVFERIFYFARQKIKYGPFIESSDMMNPVGCNSDQLQDILSFCGFDSFKLGNDIKLFFFKEP